MMKLSWSKRFWQFKNGFLLSLLVSSPTVAQIKPDATLPHNSLVTPMSGNVIQIDGGTRAGNNLFHSFSQFNVSTGGTAHFNNASDVRNIFSRVTGGITSNIDGILQTNGTANLFLLNPNGIIFGQNAQLNIGGSFAATSASAIEFGNQGTFSASTPNNPSLLTVNPSALLFNQIAAQPIAITSQRMIGKEDNGTPVYEGLAVPHGNSLLVVGGDVSLNGGFLTALGGRIELGGLAGAGRVDLNVDGNNLSLNFPVGVLRANVSLTNRASAYVEAGGGGSIAVNVRNLKILAGSNLIAGIAKNLGSVGSKAGNIEINATDTVTLDGVQNISSGAYNRVEAGAVGNGGDINITTGSLDLTDGARLNTGIAGKGNIGSVNINARDQVSADGVNVDNLIMGVPVPSGIVSSVESKDSNNGGSINITARLLSLTNGALLNASGSPGVVNINTWSMTTLDGIGKNHLPTGIFSGVVSGADSGAINGGDINIITGSLSLTNGATLAASTLGQGNGGNISVQANNSVSLANVSTINSAVGPGGVGNGGNIYIQAQTIFLTNGSQILASVLGQLGSTKGGNGQGGNIRVDATDSVNLSGVSSVQLPIINILNTTGTEFIPTLGLPSGLFTRIERGATGQGGNIIVNTGARQGQITVQNGAQITTDSSGAGNAGNIINIIAKSLTLDNGSILLSSVSGEGGNLENLQVQDLRLRHGSSISTSAGLNNIGGGNGGNIGLNTQTFIFLENSNIKANAYQGKGGNINIYAQGIFMSSDSVINASSKLGINGAVTIKTPGINPTQGLTTFPTVFSVPQLAVGCLAGGRRESSKFVVTGRGGLPPNAIEPLGSNLGDLDADNPTLATTANSDNSTPKPIVEAQALVRGPHGEFLLVSQVPKPIVYSFWQTPLTCRALQPSSESQPQQNEK